MSDSKRNPIIVAESDFHFKATARQRRLLSKVVAKSRMFDPCKIQERVRIFGLSIMLYQGRGPR